MIDIGRALRTAIITGNVRFGLEQTKKTMETGEARLVIVSDNCPEESIKRAESVRVIEFSGNNMELGAACGKPFSISALAVLDPGESNILSA